MNDLLKELKTKVGNLNKPKKKKVSSKKRKGSQ